MKRSPRSTSKQWTPPTSKCKKCDRPALKANYGHCAEHRTVTAALPNCKLCEKPPIPGNYGFCEEHRAVYVGSTERCQKCDRRPVKNKTFCELHRPKKHNPEIHLPNYGYDREKSRSRKGKREEDSTPLSATNGLLALMSAAVERDRGRDESDSREVGGLKPLAGGKYGAAPDGVACATEKKRKREYVEEQAPPGGICHDSEDEAEVEPLQANPKAAATMTSRHLSRVHKECPAARHWTLDLLSSAPIDDGEYSTSLERAAEVKIVTVEGCEGAVLLRGMCSPDETTQIEAALHSEEAQRLAWTGLRDGGNANGRLEFTAKAYCGASLDMLIQRSGRYKQQLLSRGRKWNSHLSSPALQRVRSRVCDFVTSSGLIHTQECQSATGVGATFSLLTEQLIKYLKDDTWFSMHYDKDRRDLSHEPVKPLNYDGPGDVIAAMGLGPGATVILQPRYDNRALAFAVDMEPGDIYLISGAARWEWLHGVSVDGNADRPRSTVVWRFLQG